MFNFAKWPTVLIVALLTGYVPLVSGQSSIDRQLVASFEAMLPSLVTSEDYRTASDVEFQLASAYKRLGKTPAACAALSQSLQHYREALVKEAATSGYGIDEEIGSVAAALYDDSDGMAGVRAKFGCKRV